MLPLPVGAEKPHCNSPIIDQDEDGRGEGEGEGGDSHTHIHTNSPSLLPQLTSEGAYGEGGPRVREETKGEHRPRRLCRPKNRKVLHRSLVLSQDTFVRRVWESFSSTLQDRLAAILHQADTGNFCRTCFAFLSEFCFWVCDEGRPLARCGYNERMQEGSEVAVLLINMLARVVGSKEGLPFYQVRNRALDVTLAPDFIGDRQTCAVDKGFLGFICGCTGSILYQSSARSQSHVSESDARRTHRTHRLEMNAFGWIESRVLRVSPSDLQALVKAVHCVWDSMPMQDLRASALSLAKFAMLQHMEGTNQANTHAHEGVHANTYTCTCTTQGEDGHQRPCPVHFNLSLASSDDLDPVLEIPTSTEMHAFTRTDSESSSSSLDILTPSQAYPMSVIRQRAALFRGEVLDYLSRNDLNRPSSHRNPRNYMHHHPAVSYEDFSMAAVAYPDDMMVLDLTGVFKPVCTTHTDDASDDTCVIT